jgi:hypothetical protein
MTKFWHIFGTIGLAVLSAVYAPLHTIIAANPLTSTILAAVWAVLGNLLTPPATLSVSLKPTSTAPAPVVATNAIPKGVNIVQP